MMSQECREVLWRHKNVEKPRDITNSRPSQGKDKNFFQVFWSFQGLKSSFLLGQQERHNNQNNDIW
jgi:hypothetical protein